MRLRILLLLALASQLSAGEPLVRAVDAIGITVEDLDRSLHFYTQVLRFEKVAESETHGAELERQTGVFGARIRTARLRLGGEHIELREFLTPKGAAYPAGSRSNDRWFQHIAIIVADMDRAYRWLRQHKVRHASTGPQRLPDWNPNAGGIQAFYFYDPDGHALEILSFPAGKGAEKWRQLASGAQPEQLFLGIDHTAIVIQDTEASLRFYRDVLGLTVAGESENHGVEQEHLNNVFGARLRITALRAATGPGIEFLEYLAPRDGRPYPADAKANDLVHWQTKLSGRNAAETARTLRNHRTTFVSVGAAYLPAPGEGGSPSIIVRDPDGHAVEIVEQPQPQSLKE